MVRSLCILVLLIFATTAAGAPRELWFYYSTNLQVDKNFDQLEPIWRRAAAAGYTTVLLADSKFTRLGGLGGATSRFQANVARVRKIAAELHLQIVPDVFPIGYSNSMLWHDPNLAEGLPVKDALFVVKNGRALISPDPAVEFSKISFKDDAVSVKAAIANVTDPSGNARFSYKLDVWPYRCYHIAVEIKTENFTGEPRVAVLAGKQSLNYANLGVKRSQNWTTHHIVFNSLDNHSITIYFGQWGAAHGKLSWRNWTIEESGPVNLLRRAGAPLTVKIENGATLSEGKDYAPLHDPKMGNIPYAGEYEVYHTPPPLRVNDLEDGTRLRISWFHPALIYDNSVMICLSEEKTWSLLEDEARRVNAMFQPHGFMMGFDEIRCLNQDDACRARNMDAGAILADAARRATALLPKDADVYVWSDMFDPHHNARADYYLVRGDLAGSWLGLDAARVTIINWNFGHRAESLRFFADRGHKQIIAGYYDERPDQILQWLDAAKDVNGVTGLMYTTWQHKYADLEAFARLANSRTN